MWAAAIPLPSTTKLCKSTTNLKNFQLIDSISTLRLLQNPRQKKQKNHFDFNQYRPLSVCFSYAGPGDSDPITQQNQEPSNNQETKVLWGKWKENSAEMRSNLAKLGLAAVLAYGIIDGITYTSFFVLSFLGYEKSTGKNPAANLQALLGIVILMWTGNNVTRPFRVAGAAALAPTIDKGLRKIQDYFNFPNLAYAFALVVGIVAGTCLTIAGLLILSRWGK